jgi:hypothetical protein
MLTRILMVLLLTQAGMAEKPWEKKPFEKWSAKDVNQLLADSPWAKTIHVVTASPSPINESAVGSRRHSAAETASLSSESAPRITYLVQLRSATPIRHAIARKSYLDSNYEKLSPDQRASLDASVKQFLAQTFVDTVVVQVRFTSNAPTSLFEVRQYWTTQTAESLKDKLFLAVGETRLEPEWFEADENMFQVRFKRPQGVPADTKISLQFETPPAGTIKQQKVVANFSPKDMTYEGAIAF